MSVTGDTDDRRDTFMILFCRSHRTIPAETLQRFRDEGAPSPRVSEGGTKYAYRWPDMKLELRVLSDLDLMRHVGVTEQFVCWMYGGRVPKRGRTIIARLEQTRLVIFFALEPLIDGDLRLGRIYTRLCLDLDPLFFFETTFYDSKFRPYLMMDRTFDREADID